MTTTQLTIDGDEAQTGRTRPDTFVWCPQCGDDVLRSRRFEHPHELPSPGGPPRVDPDDEDDEDDEPEVVGAWYDVEIEVCVTKRLRLAATSDYCAKERADELHWDEPAADAHVLHTDVRELSPITDADDDAEELPGWPW